MWAFHDGMGWWMVFGGFLSLAFMVALFGLVVWSLSRLGEGHSTIPQREDPLEIAKRRLAGGEINREEFEELAELLHSARRSQAEVSHGNR